VSFHDPHLPSTSRSTEIRRVGWNIMRGVRLHSPSLTASKTSSKTMSGN
jgi:hypothetical protein